MTRVRFHWPFVQYLCSIWLFRMVHNRNYCSVTVESANQFALFFPKNSFTLQWQMVEFAAFQQRVLRSNDRHYIVHTFRWFICSLPMCWTVNGKHTHMLPPHLILDLMQSFNDWYFSFCLFRKKMLSTGLRNENIIKDHNRNVTSETQYTVLPLGTTHTYTNAYKQGNNAFKKCCQLKSVIVYHSK